MKVKILSDAELRQSIFIGEEELACIEGALTRAARGKAATRAAPPLGVEDAGAAVVDATHVDGLRSFSVGVRPRFPAGRPPLPGPAQTLVHDAATGALQAVFLDSRWMTECALAHAAAAAAKHLAAPDARSVAFVGLDGTSRATLDALRVVRPLTKVLVWSPDADAATAFAAEVDALDGLRAAATDEAEAASLSAELVVTSAAGGAPPLTHEALEGPALALGVGAPGAFDEALLRAASRVLADDPDGVLHGQDMPEGVEVEHLGAVTGREAPGRGEDPGVIAVALTVAPALRNATTYLAWRKSQKYKLGTDLDAVTAFSQREA